MAEPASIKNDKGHETLSQEPDEQSSFVMNFAKLAAASVFLWSALSTFSYSSSETSAHRRLTQIGDTIPSYMEPLLKDLKERKKLMEETPPEEIKYHFEYTGPLQVS